MEPPAARGTSSVFADEILQHAKLSFRTSRCSLRGPCLCPGRYPGGGDGSCTPDDTVLVCKTWDFNLLPVRLGPAEPPILPHGHAPDQALSTSTAKPAFGRPRMGALSRLLEIGRGLLDTTSHSQSPTQPSSRSGWLTAVAMMDPTWPEWIVMLTRLSASARREGTRVAYMAQSRGHLRALWRPRASRCT